MPNAPSFYPSMSGRRPLSTKTTGSAANPFHAAAPDPRISETSRHGIMPKLGEGRVRALKVAETEIRADGIVTARRDVALADAGALEDPVVAGFHNRFEIAIGKDFLRQVAAGADDAGIGHGCDRNAGGNGSPRSLWIRFEGRQFGGRPT